MSSARIGFPLELRDPAMTQAFEPKPPSRPMSARGALRLPAAAQTLSLGNDRDYNDPLGTCVRARLGRLLRGLGGYRQSEDGLQVPMRVLPPPST